MLGYAVFALRYLLWLARNLRRRLRRPPNYVVFILEGAYPDLRPPRARFCRRRFFHDARLSFGWPRPRGVYAPPRALTLNARCRIFVGNFIPKWIVFLLGIGFIPSFVPETYAKPMRNLCPNLCETYMKPMPNLYERYAEPIQSCKPTPFLP